MTTQTAAPSDTKFKKGQKKGPGRPKGAQNKVSKELKEMILEALDGAGGVDYLEKRANDPRTAAAFLGLVGKVLPMTLTGTGEGGAITVNIKQF
jgi:hypothetical protein